MNVLHIDLPPLRSRGDDVLILAQRFLARASAHTADEERPITGFSLPAAQRLVEYPWPGNVRELANCVERCAAFTRHSEILLDDLPDKVRNFRASHVVVMSNNPS